MEVILLVYMKQVSNKNKRYWFNTTAATVNYQTTSIDLEHIVALINAVVYPALLKIVNVTLFQFEIKCS